MSSDYTREVLRVVIAKICQTIGWHSINSTPLEIMVDVLRRYLSELTKLTNAYATQFGHTQPNLDELGLAFRDMHINIADLEEYVRYVDSAPPLEVPQFPIRKDSHLNFLKPGSNEVVTRPVHIYEHLPPMLPESEDTEASALVKEEIHTSPNADQNAGIFKRPADISPNENTTKRPRLVMEEEGRPTREISSVMMTTSGFLSPAREGKLPEARTPINTIDTPSSTLSQGNCNLSNDQRFERKGPKLTKDFKKVDKRKDKASKELFKPLVDEIATKKFTTMKDVVRLKAMKANVANSNNNISLMTDMPVKGPGLKTQVTKQSNKGQPKVAKTEKQFVSSPAPSQPKTSIMPDKFIEGKLSSEPDKSKLNIFKKISKVKDDKMEKVEKVKVKDELRTSDTISQESRESSPDLIIDESEMKNWDQTKLASVKTSDVPVKQEIPEKPQKVMPPTDVTNKMYDVVKSPHSEKDFLYDDDLSPPGTPSTPKTPEMPTHSPPLKVEKEIKRKRKEKTKTKNKAKVARYSLSPRRNKNENFDGELDRPKTPNDPINLVKDEAVAIPPQPVFSFFPGFIPGPGLIPAPMPNPLFPRLPLAAGMPKHGFGQPAHIPPAMPVLPYVATNKPPPVEEAQEKLPSSTVPDPVIKAEKPETGIVKEKHKKDKKDKPKKKNKKDKIKNKSEKRKLKEEKKEKDKEKIKKEKKEKKKEKEREHEGSVPKLTLKIGSPRPPTPDVQGARKIMIKPVIKKEEESLQQPAANTAESQDKREPSPELARISALITRPPKLKASKESHTTKEEPGAQQTSTSPKQSGPLPGRSRINTNASKSPSTANTAAIAGVKTGPGKQKPVVLKQQSSVVDNDGNKVWICPGCGGQDDGSPMIGCDDCDAWYHWVCVGIQVPPDDNEDWYCRICIVKKQETLQMDKKKKRKKKEKKEY